MVSDGYALAADSDDWANFTLQRIRICLYVINLASITKCLLPLNYQ